MSVFVDINEPEAAGTSGAVRAPRDWRGRLTRAALPVLSLVVFFVVWQFAAVSGVWNQTFVPYPSTVWRAFVDVSTAHDGVRGYAGYLLWEHLYMVLISGVRPVPGRTAGVVFQQPRLFPWRTVGGNVELALKYAGVSRDHRPGRRDELLHRVGLQRLAHRHIWEISGGQQQRVAIARALASEGSGNSLLLRDEPFAALDALTRERLQEDVRAVSEESGRTTVLVTHSADEAVFLGSRIVVLTARPGRIALDLTVELPRTEADSDELRRSSEYQRLRQEISRAIKSAAA